jgi:hypothetical protein
MAKYLDFEIVQTVPFKAVLDWLNFPYTEKDNQLIGKGFIVNVKKNMYWSTDDNRGSIIDFVSRVKGCGPRRAAELLDEHFF